MEQLGFDFPKAERVSRDERKAQIIDKIDEYGNLSYFWIAKLCGIHKTYARELTNELVEEGFVILLKEVLFVHQVNPTKIFALGNYRYNHADDRFGLGIVPSEIYDHA